MTTPAPLRHIGRDEPGVLPPDGRSQVWDLLRDLQPREGAALLLWVGFRLPQQIVAATLGVPQSSINGLCTRALRALRARASAT